MRKLLLSFALIVLAFGATLPLAAPAFAIEPIVDEDARSADGPDLSLNSFLRIGVRVGNAILGVVGALTLAMFVYGGVMMLISGGNSERVTKGKQILVGSAVGLIIVFGSYTIISFVVNNLLGASGEYAFDGQAPIDTGNQNQQQENACQKLGGNCKNKCDLNDTTLEDNGYCSGRGMGFCCKTASNACGNNNMEQCALCTLGVEQCQSCNTGKKCGNALEICLRKGAGCTN